MRKYSLLAVSVLALCVSCCAQARFESPEDAFNSVVGKNTSGDKMDKGLRLRAIEKAAVAFGVQEGRQAQAEKLNALYQSQAEHLDTIFNFKALYLHGGELQPPILSDVRNVSILNNDGHHKTTIKKVYSVISEAKLTNVPMTWRSYLKLSTKPTGKISKALLPKDSEEESLWQKYINQGWQRGVAAANTEAQARMASLSQSFEGMLLYRKLAQRGMIEPPKISYTNKGVELSSDAKTINIGSSTRVISKDSYFVGKPNQFKPAMYGISSQDVRS